MQQLLFLDLQSGLAGSYYMWRVPTLKAAKAKLGTKKQKVKAAASAVPNVE